MPRISVIIPTHNRPQLLPRAVDSARAAGKDVEVIVVDDASIDETADVCRNLRDIKYMRVDRNQGVAGARNVGLLASTGEYIAFLDDDDLRLPGSLDLQAGMLDADPDAGFVCGAMIMADQNYQPTGEIIQPKTGGDIFWQLVDLEFPVMPLCTLIRKACFLRIGLLNRHLNGIDDWDIFTRIAALYPVAVTPEPVGLYRQPTPASGQGSSARATQLLRVVRHQPNLLKLPRATVASAAQRRMARKRMRNRISENLIWTAAARHLPSLNVKAAAANISVALLIDPLAIFRPAPYEKLAKKLLLRTVSIAPQ